MRCRPTLCRTRLRLAPLLLLGAAACAAPALPRLSSEIQPVAAADNAAVEEAIATAARQVRRCYRPPRIGSLGRSIVTRLHVRYAADGTLVGLPTLVSQSGVTPANRFFAGRMAEAATMAVIRCAPLTLPGALHERGWSEMDLTFGPRALG